jgi:hypothetical protein
MLWLVPTPDKYHTEQISRTFCLWRHDWQVDQVSVDQMFFEQTKEPHRAPQPYLKMPSKHATLNNVKIRRILNKNLDEQVN